MRRYDSRVHYKRALLSSLLFTVLISPTMGGLFLLGGQKIAALHAATLTEDEVHCIVDVGPGRINWTTGGIEIDVLITHGGGIEKEGKNFIPPSNHTASAFFPLSSYGDAIYSRRLEPYLSNLEEQAALDDAKLRMTQMLTFFADRYRQKEETSPHELLELKAEIASKVNHAEVLFSGHDMEHQALILRSTIFGEFLNLIFPATLLKIPDIEVIDPENQYGRREKLTGMVVDAREIGFEPILFPSVVDEQGREVYGPLFASREYAVEKGLCSYAYLPESALVARRVGKNPVWVKGLRREGAEGDRIVIPISDAEKIRKRPERHGFMKACKVLILVPKIVPAHFR